MKDSSKIIPLIFSSPENLKHSEDNSNRQDYIKVSGVKWPLIPEGTYQVGYVKHEFNQAFGPPRVYVHFRILDFGEQFEKILYRAYRLNSLKSPGRKNSSFTVGKGSDFVYELALVTDKRSDRLLPNDFEGLLLEAKVGTVIKDYKQRPTPKPLQYSVIREIIGKIDL